MTLTRKIIETTTALLGRAKRSRRITPPAQSSDVLLNVGCGLAVAEGWVNVDGSLNALFASWPRAMHRILYRLSGASQYYTMDEYCRLLGSHTFVHHNLSYGVPFADGCAHFIYTSHFLEHLPRETAATLLKESHRVLRPGGVLRVCVPDLAHAVSLYPEGRERMLDNYFFVEEGDSSYARHRYMYDFELLERVLREAGFEEITRCEYRQGKTPNLNVLDNRPDETLFVEAIKPEDADTLPTSGD
ncbi:MAG: methyltransferase domain-containing protein [Leptospirillia bacterium]